jgi:hypothetical protein
MRFLGQGRTVTLHDAAEACLLIRATAEAAARQPERGTDAASDNASKPNPNQSTQELLNELRELPDAALGYFVGRAFQTGGREDAEVVRHTSRMLHVVRHMQQLIVHEWMERKEPMLPFTAAGGAPAIFVVKASRRKEWLQKLFGSVSDDLIDLIRPPEARSAGSSTEIGPAARAIRRALRSYNPVRRAAAASLVAVAKAEFEEVTEATRDRTKLLGPAALELVVPGNHTHVSAVCVSYRSAEFRTSVEAYLALDALHAHIPAPTGFRWSRCVVPFQAPMLQMAGAIDSIDVPRWMPELIFGDLEALRKEAKRPGVNMEDFV